MPLDNHSQQSLDMKRLMPHVEELATKFDTVHIFVSRHDPTAGHTVGANSGAGNWYARRGQIRDWMIQQEEEARMDARDEFEEEE